MTQPMESINSKLRQLVSESILTPESMLKVSQSAQEGISEWTESVTAQITSMISEWESAMGENDKTFYSLGLRRAIDIISGQTAYSQLCNSHQNKMIYKNPATMLSVILKTEQEQGVKLTWFRCEVHNGYHLTKWKNKKD